MQFKLHSSHQLDPQRHIHLLAWMSLLDYRIYEGTQEQCDFQFSNIFYERLLST